MLYFNKLRKIFLFISHRSEINPNNTQNQAAKPVLLKFN